VVLQFLQETIPERNDALMGKPQVGASGMVVYVKCNEDGTQIIRR
jgi:hypothetical protein